MERDVGTLAELMRQGKTAVLSGAGLSTESGIPDYRGSSGSSRRVTPMTYDVFIGDPVARQRYWARSHLGWRTFRRAVPNQGHEAVAALQRRGLLTGIVTQNVDGLHTAAGAAEVIELHGNLDRVICVQCGDLTARAELSRRLDEANPDFAPDIAAINPDGDVELAETSTFHIVNCTVCRDGVLKPDVVFFGETVPLDRVHQSYAAVENADVLLVLGSSLAVMSGRRFVVRAVKHGIPVAIINQGPTREDARAAVTIDAPLGTVLPRLCERLQS